MMTIEIFFGRAIKYKTSNYRWLDYDVPGWFDKEPWKRTTEDYWGFEHWLFNKFEDEQVDKHDFSNANKEVLVVRPSETLCDHRFFKSDGSLAQAYIDDKLDDLYDSFVKGKNKAGF